jgi:hypothetical protein
MRTSRIGLLVACCAAACVAAAAFASAPDAAPLAAAAGPAKAESAAATISTGVAQVTGLAISPLLVFVAIGLADFFRFGGFSAESGAMPLHANPWILFPLATVLLVLGIKKFLSPAVPMPIRKVFDAAEYFEAKLSALVVAGILLPSIISTMAAVSSVTEAPAAIAGPGAWIMGLGGYALAIPLVLVIFGCVWITFHVIDALIVLSPFAILDAILVAVRVLILAIVGVALLISPYLAVAVCAPIIVASLLVAGWCVRLDLFALAVASDILLLRNKPDEAAGGPMRAFLAARGHGAPIRTMGRVEPRPEGGVRFTYRPFFMLPKRTLEIPAENPVLVRGFLWSTLRDESRRRGIVALPPRYRAHAAAIGARLRADVRDGLVLRSWKGLMSALRSIVSPDTESAEAVEGAASAGIR